MHKVISIVVPVYNMAQFIRPCLESILMNGYDELQIIVIDGGSTDGTLDIIKGYSTQLFYWVSEKDDGQSSAINKGFEVATGDIMTWLNADEEYIQGVLKKVACKFQDDPKLDFVYGNRLDCDSKGNVIREIKFPKMHPSYYTLYYGRVLPTDCSFWTRHMHELTGSLDEGKFQHLAMDYDWFLRMGIHVNKYKYLDFFISKFKQQPNRKTSNAEPEKIVELWKIARNRFLSENKHSPANLLIGWAFWSFFARIQKRNFQIPSFKTALKIMIRN